MSKPWFLDQPENPSRKGFQDEIRAALGRDMDDVYGTRANGAAKPNGESKTQSA
jgi:hypothetical protein